MAGFVGRDVLGKGLLKRAEVDVAEWGGLALVRELSSAEIEDVRVLAGQSMNDGVLDGKAVGRFERALVVAGWINADGSQVLSDEDVSLLGGESARAVTLLASKISELSGLTPSTQADAKKN